MSKASAYFTVGNISDSHDVKRIKKELNEIAGVLSVSVNGDENKVAVDFDTTGTSQGKIGKMLCEMGYEISSDKLENHVM